MIDFKAEAKSIEQDIIKWRRELHKIPEIGFDTIKTRAYIEDALRSLQIEFTGGYAQNGIVALIKKADGEFPPLKTFAIRSDIDGLEIQEETGLDFASQHAGKMHACGHDAHTAMALGAAKILSKHQRELKGNIKLIFQPAEEGPGGAKIMIEQGVLENPEVDAIIGLHVDVGTIFEEVGLGQIGIKTGPVMGFLDRFILIVKGRGGHGGYPDKTVDPIAISASIIENLQTIISRELHPVHPGVISVCKIAGGAKYNVTPEEVYMEGTTRCIHQEDRDKIARRIRELSESIAEGRGASIDFEFIDGYPVVDNSKVMTDFLHQSALGLLDPDQIVVLNKPVMGGEDMAFYLQKVPGTLFFLGAAKKTDGTIYPIHHAKFDLDESVLWTGSGLLAKVAYEWLEENC